MLAQRTTIRRAACLRFGVSDQKTVLVCSPHFVRLTLACNANCQHLRCCVGPFAAICVFFSFFCNPPTHNFRNLHHSHTDCKSEGSKKPLSGFSPRQNPLLFLIKKAKVLKTLVAGGTPSYHPPRNGATLKSRQIDLFTESALRRMLWSISPRQHANKKTKINGRFSKTRNFIDFTPEIQKK